MSSLTGFSTVDVYGRKLVDEFVQLDFKDSVSGILKNALMGIETANFEFPLLTSGDHVVEVLLNATTRRDAQDNVIGVVGIGQDITDARAKRDAEMKQRAAGNHKFWEVNLAQVHLRNTLLAICLPTFPLFPFF